MDVAKHREIVSGKESQKHSSSSWSAIRNQQNLQKKIKEISDYHLMIVYCYISSPTNEDNKSPVIFRSPANNLLLFIMLCTHMLIL
jgi:hypothetical protein